jgi:hypothetical protein
MYDTAVNRNREQDGVTIPPNRKHERSRVSPVERAGDGRWEMEVCSLRAFRWAQLNFSFTPQPPASPGNDSGCCHAMSRCVGVEGDEVGRKKAADSRLKPAPGYWCGCQTRSAQRRELALRSRSALPSNKYTPSKLVKAEFNVALDCHSFLPIEVDG